MTETHEIDRELVMAWVDGELPASQAREIAAHVDECAACRALTAELREVSTRLAAWSVGPAPASLRAPAVAAAGTRSPVVAMRRPWAILLMPRAYAIGAAAVVVIALVASLQRGMRDDASAGQPPLSVMMSNESPVPGGVAGGMIPTAAPTERALADRSTGRQAPADAPAGTQMIVRTAAMEVLVEKFDEARAALERLVRAHDGSFALLLVTTNEPSRRTLRATVRVPNARMDPALEAMRGLGKVRKESQSSDDVTDSFRDLSVRLANARVEERRLNDLLARRTGDLSDVLAVEEQVMRVRGEIERMDAESRALQGRVAQSTISVQIDEVYRAELTTAPVSLATRMSNAFVDGTRAAIDSLVGLALGLLTVGPTLLLWSAIVGVPVWLIVRRVRRSSRSTEPLPRA